MRKIYEKNTKLLYIIAVSILLLPYIGYSKQNINTEVLILKDKIALRDSYDKGKVIEALGLYEKVKVISTNVKNGYLEIETENGKRGWVEEKYTSYVPGTWKKYVFGEKVKYGKKCVIYVPNKQSFILDNYYDETWDNTKLYNKNYFVLFYKSKGNYGDQIKKMKKCEGCSPDDIKEIKRIINEECKQGIDMDEEPKKYYIEYNDNKVIFVDELFSVAEWQGRYYILYLLSEDKDVIQRFIVFTYKVCADEEYFLMAKKILFSARFE
jgi:hypothetical protein